MIRPAADWDRFWFAPRTTRALGLCRIAIGLVTLYEFALYAGRNTRLFFSDAGVLAVQTVLEATGRPVPTLLALDGAPWLAHLCVGAVLVAAFLFTIGYRTRLSALILYGLVLSFQERNVYVFNGSDLILRNMLFWFLFAPEGGGASFSLDRLRRLRNGKEDPGEPLRAPPWAQRMMQIQVVFLYFATAIWKLRYPSWSNGEAMYYQLGQVDFYLRGLEQLLNFPSALGVLTSLVIVSELYLGVFLLFRATRPYAILLGVALHGWIIAFMTIPVFGPVMLCSYLAFLDEDEVDRATGWLARVSARRPRATGRGSSSGAGTAS